MCSTQTVMFGEPEHTCRICGRPLTDPKSIARGIGPICARQHGGLAASAEEKQVISQTTIRKMKPVGVIDEFVFECDEKGRQTCNFPQRIVYHSPTGMTWGYPGSGPADTALNVLIHFVDGATALRLHQRFKWDRIVGLPSKGKTVIPAGDIEAWITAQLAETTQSDVGDLWDHPKEDADN